MAPQETQQQKAGINREREKNLRRTSHHGGHTPPTRHEGEAAGQLHDSCRGGFQDGPICTDVAAGRRRRHVVGDGEGRAAAHLHGGGGGGHGGGRAAGGARYVGHRERGLQGFL